MTTEKLLLFKSSDNIELFDVIVSYFISKEMIDTVIKDGGDTEFILICDNSINKNGVYFDGIGHCFKTEGLINTFNDYFTRKRINMKASKCICNNLGAIRIEKFLRMNHVSKVDVKEDIGRDVIEGDKYKEIFKDRKEG